MANIGKKISQLTELEEKDYEDKENLYFLASDEDAKDNWKVKSSTVGGQVKIGGQGISNNESIEPQKAKSFNIISENFTMIDNGNGYDIYLIPVKAPEAISSSWNPEAKKVYVFNDDSYSLFDKSLTEKHACYIAADTDVTLSVNNIISNISKYLYLKVESRQNNATWEKKFEQWIPLSESTSGKTKSVSRGDNNIVATVNNIVYNDVVIEDNKLIHKKDETETSFTLRINNAAIINGGGYHKVYYGVVKSDEETFDVEKTSLVQYVDELFVSKGSTPTLEGVTISGGTDTIEQISGLKYRTAGSTRHIKVDNTTNTQNKVSSYDYYIKIDAAGKESTVSSTENDKTTNFNKGYEGDITLGKTDNGNGSGTIAVTPCGYNTGTPFSYNISQFWGEIPTSSPTKENFGKESGNGGYRMKTPTSTSVDFVSTEDVTTHRIDVNGTTCCSAVCQYNSLKHPNNASADATGKTYTTDLPACFIRKFTGSIEPLIFKLQGTNLIQSGKVQVFWKDGNVWYDLSTPITGSVIHSGSSTITKNILVENDEHSTTDMIIAIIVQPGAKPIGQITATYSR